MLSVFLFVFDVEVGRLVAGGAVSAAGVDVYILVGPDIAFYFVADHLAGTLYLDVNTIDVLAVFGGGDVKAVRVRREAGLACACVVKGNGHGAEVNVCGNVGAFGSGAGGFERYVRDHDLLGLAGAVLVEADDLDIDISGASSLKDLHVNGKSMEVDCSGASKVSVSGNFSKEVGIDVSGASRMTYTGDSETLEADMSGASSFKCEGKHSTADIKCSGASNAEFAGKVGKVEYECSGASSIDAENYMSKTASIELTGACKAKVHASEELYYNVSRSSKITYYGDAKLYNRTADYNVIKGR